MERRGRTGLSPAIRLRVLAALLISAVSLPAPLWAVLPAEPPFSLTTYCTPTLCPDAVLALEGDRVYVADSSTLAALDITDPTAPTPSWSIPVIFPHGIAVGGGLAVGARSSSPGSELFHLDLSDPSAPQIGTTLVLHRFAAEIALRGNRLFVANSYDGLRIFDVSDPAAFVETAHLDRVDLLGNHSVDVVNVVLKGSLAFVAADVFMSGAPGTIHTLLAVVDISDPDRPLIVGRYLEDREGGVRGLIGGLTVDGDRVYLAKRGALRILDVSDPSQPALVGSFLPNLAYADQFFDIVVADSVAYIANWELGLRFIDVADPAAPIDLAIEPGDFAPANSYATSLAVSKGIAYLGVVRSGLQIIAVDGDQDGVAAPSDNCPAIANPEQEDVDGNGVGDACDVCPSVGFIGPDDSDLDGWADFCDVCPSDFDPDQSDRDGDGTGDVCNDADDADGDDYADSLDVCPDDFDPDQADFDMDRIGDVCDPFPFDADHERAALQRDLANALTQVSGLEEELGMCLDRRSFLDDDGDGEEDATDRCPRTSIARDVDSSGCSRAQFCESQGGSGFRKLFACFRSDWKNDQPLANFPGDCGVSWGHRQFWSRAVACQASGDSP